MLTAANHDKELKLAYAGGFMDGEGSFMIQKSYHSRYGYTQFCAKVSASQVKIEPLLLMQELLGGKIQKIHTSYGYEYQWYLSGKNAANAAEALIPYLILKRPHAEILVEFQKTVIGYFGKRIPLDIHEKRAALRAEIQALNAKRSKVDAKRLSEETPLGDDATVRSSVEMNQKTPSEMMERLH